MDTVSRKINSNYPPLLSGWYLVGILFVAYLFSIIDRQVLGLFLVPVQQSLGVSDTQMGLLHGFSFAIFYAVMGLPIARLIDSGNRRLIICIGMFVWSAATVACGFASEYWQLLLCRIFVGVGEATLVPGTVSLIADTFKPHDRGKAMGMFSAGGTTGMGLSMLAGALLVGYLSTLTFSNPTLAAMETWQLVFVVVGVPGIIISFFLMTTREPGRRNEQLRAPISEVWGYLKGNGRTYTLLFTAACMYGIAYLAHLAWTPALLIRRFDLTTPEAGLLFGLVLIFCAPTGAAFGGYLADHLLKKGITTARVWVSVLATAGLGVFGVLYTLTDNLTVLTVLMVPCVFLSSCYIPCLFAAIQDITPGTMRGQMTAIYSGVENLIGFGLGPLLVGILTDKIFNDPMMIHLSMALVIGIPAVLGVVIFIVGMAPYRVTYSIENRSSDEDIDTGDMAVEGATS